MMDFELIALTGNASSSFGKVIYDSANDQESAGLFNGQVPRATTAMDVRYVSFLCFSNTSLITLPIASFTMPFPVYFHILTSIHFPLIKSF